MWFKKKRPHAPDDPGIANYKKQRLILDFENLSLEDQLSKPDDSTTRWVIPTALLQTTDSNSYFYKRLRQNIESYKLQLIKWVDMSRWIYWKWWQWYTDHQHDDLMDIDMEG